MVDDTRTPDLFGGKDRQNRSRARQLRDEGIARALAADAEWMRRAVVRALELRKPGDEVTGEKIRFHVRSYGLMPSKPNCWGGLTKALITKGLLIDTHRSDQPTDPKSHASRKPVWRWA